MTNEAIKVTPVVGMLLLLEYGNGTQIARVLSITPRGVMTIERGSPTRLQTTSGGPSVVRFVWKNPSKMRIDDSRILSELPANDPRLSIPLAEHHR